RRRLSPGRRAWVGGRDGGRAWSAPAGRRRARLTSGEQDRCPFRTTATATRCSAVHIASVASPSSPGGRLSGPHDRVCRTCVLTWVHRRKQRRGCLRTSVTVLHQEGTARRSWFGWRGGSMRAPVELPRQEGPGVSPLEEQLGH